MRAAVDHDASLLTKCASFAHGVEVGLDPQMVLAFAAHTSKGWAAKVPLPFALFPNPVAPPSAGMLRIGYLSGTGFQDFTTTAHFIEGVIAQHGGKAAAVSVFCYAGKGDDGSPVRRRIR